MKLPNGYGSVTKLSGNQRKPSSRTITSAWKYCHSIYGMRVKDLRARHIKSVMENGYIISDHGKNAGEKIPASPGTKAWIKSMFNLILDYALEYELVDQNYARTFDLSNDIIKEKEAATRGISILLIRKWKLSGIIWERFAL